LLTIDMHVHYLDAAVEEDLLARATVRRRGQRIVFLTADVVGRNDRPIAHGELSYMVVT
jgi:acyl-coenzyme A thioesterase PaaI-like protein